MTQAIQPRFAVDPVTGQYTDLLTGERAAPPPPKQTWRYVVADRERMGPVRIAQRVFKPGTTLGTGNVALHYPDVDRCWFKEEADYTGPDPVEAGHIFPRLRSGAIVAELVEEESQ